MRILIADDEPDSREILQRRLQMLGHEVGVAADGAEAWDLHRRAPYHVIVTDWFMPNLDGLGLCGKVREHDQPFYTYIIMLTATFDGEENYRHAMEKGVDDFQTKPCLVKELEIRLSVAQRIMDFQAKIRRLQELIPICSYCRRIRDDKDYWQRIETYLHTCTGAMFSHGVCPDCFETHIKPQLNGGSEPEPEQ